MPLLLAFTAALCPILLVWGVHLAARPPVPKDVIVVRTEKKKGFGPLGALVESLGRPFAPALLGAMTMAGRTRLRRRIGRAGLRMTLDDYARNKAGNIVLYSGFGVLVLLAGQPLLGLVLILVGLFQTDFLLWNEARDRQGDIEKSLPDFLDVLTVTVTAGLSFRHALERVAQSMEGSLSDEMMTAMRQMELGTPLRDAFEELRQRNDSDALSSFVTAILQAEELGAPLTGALNQISVDMRRDAHQKARRRAQRADPKITMITTFLMVPAMMLLIFAAFYFSTGGALSNVLG
ncbi:type II secretion system F family protein [Spirillospora sp. NPDC029432]|uniref:type II secretion system F family protein n=1 Tax=Spirillospora sp. NPDC029432 TaxID=3154599 RepID=UPI003455F0C7